MEAVDPLCFSDHGLPFSLEMYANILEHLDLTSGMSVLQLGVSDNGYMAALVAGVVGRSLHQCVDARPNVIEESQKRMQAFMGVERPKVRFIQGFPFVQSISGSLRHNIAPLSGSTPLYDRVLVSGRYAFDDQALADLEMSLVSLLKLGGMAVAIICNISDNEKAMKISVVMLIKDQRGHVQRHPNPFPHGLQQSSALHSLAEFATSTPKVRSLMSSGGGAGGGAGGGPGGSAGGGAGGGAGALSSADNMMLPPKTPPSRQSSDANFDEKVVPVLNRPLHPTSDFRTHDSSAY
jgi:protein-L-isoaspartate O-methyltransferase